MIVYLTVRHGHTVQAQIRMLLEWQSDQGFTVWERTDLVVRALDSGSGDPGSILGWVGVLFP